MSKATSISQIEQAIETAPAKLNLCLHVVGQDANNYHLLDSIVCFADLADQISLISNDALHLDELTFTGVFKSSISGVSAQDNLVIKAVQACRVLLEKNAHTLPYFKIELTKDIPLAGGLGGGSADAAAVIRIIQRHCEQEGINLNKEDWLDLALTLGADVPICLKSKLSRMRGIGEIITPVNSELASMPVLIVNPMQDMPTKSVFSELKNKTNAPIAQHTLDSLANAVTPLAFTDILKQFTRNDLTAPAINLLPNIDHVISALDILPECLFSTMSGSGASCFGIFGTVEEAQKAELDLKQQYPQWWCQSTKISLKRTTD